MKKLMLLTMISSIVFTNVSFSTIINIPADYSTIQAGIDSCAVGDTILVQPNTYNENINFNGKNVVLASLFLTTWNETYISSTIIDGGAMAPVISFQNGESGDAVVMGFTLRNGYYFSSGGIYCLNSNPTIRNNIIRDNDTGFEGGGIYCSMSNPVIRNNLIFNNNAFYSGGGIYCTNSSPQIINNTIFGNSTGTGGGLYVDSNSNPTIINTIFWDNTASQGPEIYKQSGVVNITYSDIEGGWIGTGNIFDYPQFADTANADFHLLAGSPCIDTGDPNLPYDPDSTRSDMGAYYFYHTSETDYDIVPAQFSLNQNYPNPFNALTILSFSIQQPSRVTVEIYNILGQSVDLAVDKYLLAGSHQIVWDGNEFPSGMYFYRIQSGNHTATRTMTLLK